MMFFLATMSFEQALVVEHSPFTVGLICIGGPIAFALIGFFLTRILVPPTLLREHHDVAGAMLGALGTLYGIFLAFIVATTWQYYDTTATNVHQEARCLGNLYANASAYEPGFRDLTRSQLRQYRDLVMNNEWQRQSLGKASPEAQILLDQVTAAYTTYQPRNAAEVAFLTESVRNINLLKELRVDRLDDSSSGLIPLLWFVLLSGAAATVGFTFLFGTHNAYAQAVMTVLLAGVIGLTLYTIVNLDFPFSGQVAISAEPFHELELK